MVVAYQKGLEEYASFLKQNGLEVVPFEQAGQADALLYAQAECGLINSLPPDSGPLLLINVYQKPKEQILSMLRHRVYSPLF